MDIEPLLQPVTAEAPCGEDLSYDAAYNELEGLAKGKEAQQFSGSDNPEWQVAAQEPDWKLIRDKCAELLARSKDLRITVFLILALLKLEGVPGLSDGLNLLLRLIREQWTGVYPQLDPEDSNDPTERVNIIGGLSKPLATFGDPIRVIERLRLAPLANSTQMGRFSLADITQLGLPTGSTATPPTEAQVEAAFRDTNVDELGAVRAAAAKSRATLGEIDSALMELVGGGNAPNFEELEKVLAEIQATLAPYLPADASEDLSSLLDPASSPKEAGHPEHAPPSVAKSVPQRRRSCHRPNLRVLPDGRASKSRPSASPPRPTPGGQGFHGAHGRPAPRVPRPVGNDHRPETRRRKFAIDGRALAQRVIDAAKVRSGLRKRAPRQCSRSVITAAAKTVILGNLDALLYHAQIVTIRLSMVMNSPRSPQFLLNIAESLARLFYSMKRIILSFRFARFLPSVGYLVS